MKNLNYKNKFYYILFISLALLFQNCELFGDDNDTPQLPEATQTGKGTFACLINGEPFVVTNTSYQTAIYQGGILQIGGSKGVGDYNENISFGIFDFPEGNKTYMFENDRRKAGYSFREGDFKCFYTSDKTISGTITLTKLDTENYIVSGTFQFTTKTDGCEDISITNGVFDLKYIP
jgi:hypothetical protein